MTITHVGVGTALKLRDADNVGVTGSPGLPSGVQTGDVLIAHVVQIANLSPGQRTDPSGWTEVDTLTDTIGPDSTALWAVYDSASPPDLTWGVQGDRAILHIVISAWHGVDTTTPINAYDVLVDESTSSATGYTPSITTTADNCVVIAQIASSRTEAMTSWTSGNLPSVTEVYSDSYFTTNAFSGNSLGVAWGSLASAGATGQQSASVSDSSTRWVGWAIALQDAVTTLTDDFNRADGNLDSDGAWYTPFNNGDLAIASNEVKAVSLGGSGQAFNSTAIWNATLSDDQFAQIDVTARSDRAQAWADLVLRRLAGDDKTYYLVQAKVGSGLDDSVTLYKRVNDSFDVVGTQWTGSFTIPFTLRAEVVGDTFKVWVDDTLVIEATDSTYTTGQVGIQLNHDPADNGGDPSTSTLRVDNFVGGDLLPIVKTIPWTHAFWADQPGFTPPADGAALTSLPTNLGSAGEFDSYGAATWVDNMAGTGKPAFQTIGEAGINKVEATNTYPTRTIVLVGRVLGTSDADLFDTNAGRSLVDVLGGLWRLFSGAVQQAANADTDLHMFVITFGSGANDTLEIDQATVIDANAGTNSGGGWLQFGYSSGGNGNTDGTQVAFAGFIDRALTQQEKDDLYAWYQAEYVPPEPEPGTGPFITIGTGGTATGTTDESKGSGFTATEDLTITSLGAYSETWGNGNTYTFSLVTVSAFTVGTVLASQTYVADGTESGWVDVDISPTLVASGTVVAILVHDSDGNFNAHFNGVTEGTGFSTPNAYAANAGATYSGGETLINRGATDFYAVRVTAQAVSPAPKVGGLTQVGGYVGSTPVIRAYRGSELVFGDAP